uniref:VWFA domain-containing protein n=1 Tax=Alexandrium monilatum TaxID=311494 RepID=A0A7S4PT54_9DINO
MAQTICAPAGFASAISLRSRDAAHTVLWRQKRFHGGKHIELASTAFMDIVQKPGLTNSDLQLALLDECLHKNPIRRYSSGELTELVREWQARIGGRTRIWQNLMQDVESLGQDAVKGAHVIIITDGMDNTSEGEFLGPRGAHRLFERLEKLNCGNVDINIVGVGSLDDEVSRVFERISSVSGGL